jgi:hypothetical protein
VKGLERVSDLHIHLDLIETEFVSEQSLSIVPSTRTERGEMNYSEVWVRELKFPSDDIPLCYLWLKIVGLWLWPLDWETVLR